VLEEETTQPSRYEGKVVAVVSGSVSGRLSIADLLAHEGAHVTVGSRFSDIEANGRTRPDAIVLDVRVPDFSDAVRARTDESAPLVPLIALCAADEDGVSAVKPLNASSVLVHPIRRARLLARLDRVLGLSKRDTTIPQRAASPEAKHVRPRALLVEDDLDNRQLLRRTFTRLGYVVTAVEDGELGLMRAKDFEYDVIVADVMMPRRNGPDMAIAIRAHEAATSRRPVPIIAITANAFEATREECERAGMNAFLRKPVVTSALEQVLAAHVDRRAAVLCVDDSAESRTLVGYFLDASLARIVHAENAIVALERTEHERIDLILMDLEMPGMNGFELAATLRGTHAHVSTPIIAVTAHDDL
jgi:CheY-like chemotaxis protein